MRLLSLAYKNFLCSYLIHILLVISAHCKLCTSNDDIHWVLLECCILYLPQFLGTFFLELLVNTGHSSNSNNFQIMISQVWNDFISSRLNFLANDWIYNMPIMFILMNIFCNKVAIKKKTFWWKNII